MRPINLKEYFSGEAIILVGVIIVFTLSVAVTTNYYIANHGRISSESIVAQISNMSSSDPGARVEIYVDLSNFERIDYRMSKLRFYSEKDDLVYQVNTQLVGEIPKEGKIAIEHFDDSSRSFVCIYPVEKRYECCEKFLCEFK